MGSFHQDPVVWPSPPSGLFTDSQRRTIHFFRRQRIPRFSPRAFNCRPSNHIIITVQVWVVDDQVVKSEQFNKHFEKREKTRFLISHRFLLRNSWKSRLRETRGSDEKTGTELHLSRLEPQPVSFPEISFDYRNRLCIPNLVIFRTFRRTRTKMLFRLFRKAKLHWNVFTRSRDRIKSEAERKGRRVDGSKRPWFRFSAWLR